ncbi:MAG: sodium:solute symporter family protein [Bacteroidota bacterium]
MVELDFIVMAVFALLIFLIGIMFTRIGSKNGQAFFEAGGATPWWINGLSLFISYFSAGTFVVWGSIAYKHGLVANAIQLTMAISGLIVTFFIASRWKKAGVATAAEFIGKRFGVREQQFYTFLILLLSLFTTAAVLYPVGKMVYVATPFSLNACIIGIGLIIVLYTAAGGLWAVLVTDVVQFVILSAAVLIVIPIAFGQIGGAANLVNKAPPHFFEAFNEDYTFGFMLAFVVYQTFYIGGNWAYVQRYTSVANPKDSKKVAGIFTILYFISPVIWMIPPMVYRIINPNLHGLQVEDAYIMLIQKVMPAGLLGLVLAGMVSATSSKANTTINMASTVFAQDIYKSLMRKKASDREVIMVARFFTLLFGVATILIAMWIPKAGGIVEVVLSTASIAGGALFAPVIWSLFSKRQTGFSVVLTTLLSLMINLFFKLLGPQLLNIKLTRGTETAFGMGFPICILLLFELYYLIMGEVSPNYINTNQPATVQTNTTNTLANQNTAKQNKFGVQVISISIGAVGIGILLLGIVASKYNNIVIIVGVLVLILSAAIWQLLAKKMDVNVK